MMKTDAAKLRVPSNYSIFRDKSCPSFESVSSIPKVFAVRDGAFYLQSGNFFVVAKYFPPLLLASDVVDIDIDDRMLMVLSYDGNVTAWKGDIEGYIDGINEDDNSRWLLKFKPSDDRLIILNHMITFRGEAGIICILTREALQLIKIDIDLNITLSETLPVPGPIHPFICEPIKKCTIWGVDDLFLVYCVDGSSLYIIRIDAVDITNPCSQCEVYDHQAWVTALSCGPSTICASGDANGGITMFSTLSGGDIEKLFYVNSFASSAITALAVVNDSMLWVGLADGSIISAQFDTQTSVLPRMHTLNIFVVGVADMLSWEPANASAPTSPFATTGFLTAANFASGSIAQVEISPTIDSIFCVYPEALTVSQEYWHKCFVVTYLYLPLMDVLVIVDFESNVKLWSLSSTQFIRNIIVNEAIEDRVYDRVMSITGFEIMADGGTVDATLFLGMFSGRVIHCHVSTSASQRTESRRYILKAEQSFSALDLLETLSEPFAARDNGCEKDDDSSANIFIEDDDQLSTGFGTDGGGVAVDSESMIDDVWTVWHAELSTGGITIPPVSVSDLFVSSLASVLCVCHARSVLYIHSLNSNKPFLNVDLDYHDLVDISTVQYSGREISQSTSPAKDRLLLALMGKSVVKILDAIKGKVIAEIDVSLSNQLTPSETVQHCGVWDSQPFILDEFDGDEESLRLESPRFVVAVVTSDLRVFMTGNHIQTKLVHAHGDFSPPVMNVLKSPDVLYYVPTGLQVFEAWSTNIVCFSTFRELVFLKVDFSQIDPVVTKSHRVQLSDEKIRILNTSVVEANSSNRTNRLLIVLSDGTSFILVM
jgi:hypothetical protein